MGDGTARPIFIAASAMVTADGTPSAIVPEDWRLQQQRHAAMISRLAMQRPAEASALGMSTAALPCRGVMMYESSLEPLVDRASLHDAVANARAIVAGTIKSITPGFFYGFPGSLIELDHLDRIKLDASYSAVRETIYIRLPYAHFESGGAEYCRESGPGFYVPRAGDRLLVFTYDRPLDPDGTLIYSTSSDVIVQSTVESEIRVPKSLSFFDSPNATISSIATSIHATLSGGRHIVNPHDGRTQ